jgi:hypothetical protein
MQPDLFKKPREAPRIPVPAQRRPLDDVDTGTYQHRSGRDD